LRPSPLLWQDRWWRAFGITANYADNHLPGDIFFKDDLTGFDVNELDMCPQDRLAKTGRQAGRVWLGCLS
jgi:hypothetical protein